MSEFYNVINEFNILVKDYNFKCPRKLWYNHLVVLSKHIEDDFYCYIIARVYKSDGSLETNLWVGPIDRPDDGLDSLSANIKIQIGYTQSLDECFFKNCESKIINLIDGGVLNSLLVTSKRELAVPSIKNNRHRVYVNYFLPLFHLVIKYLNYDIRSLKNKKKCQLAIEEILLTLDGDMKNYFEKLGDKETKKIIWELCYIYSL